MDNDISANIFDLGQVNNSMIGAVFINWTANPGNYDLSHYTVELFGDRALKLSVLVSTDNNDFPAFISPGIIGLGRTPAVILPVTLPVMGDTQVFARVTTTSKCNQRSNGVETRKIDVMITNGGKPSIILVSPIL